MIKRILCNRGNIKLSLSILALFCLTFLGGNVNAQTTCLPLVEPAAPYDAGSLSASNWLSFMFVFDSATSADCGGAGSECFNVLGWGLDDLVITYDGTSEEYCFSPTPIDTDDGFWYQNPGGPDRVGNKDMVAIFYQEQTGIPVGENLVFSVEVTSENLSPDHETCMFIQDFAPGFASAGRSEVCFNGPGIYTVSLTVASGMPLQHGFVTRGPNVWPDDAANFGSAKFRVPQLSLANTSPACPGDDVTFTASPMTEVATEPAGGATIYTFFVDTDGSGALDNGEVALQSGSANTYTINASTLTDGDVISVAIANAGGCEEVVTSAYAEALNCSACDANNGVLIGNN